MTTYDLGDTVPLSVDVTTSAGVPVDCATMVLTVTLPDGTTTTPTLTNTPTGSYYVDYVPATGGHYTARFTGTAPNVGFTDSFDVVDPGPQVVGLDQMKAHLRITSDTHDEELRTFLFAATTAAESYCGRVFRRQTVTEVRDGRGTSLALFKGAPISVTSVTESGTLLAATDYAVSNGLLVRLGSSYTESEWATGIQNVTVVYVAGMATIPEDLQHAVKELTRHLWETQRAGTNIPSQGGDDTYIPGLAYTFPRRILELLKFYMIQTPGFA